MALHRRFLLLWVLLAALAWSALPTSAHAAAGDSDAVRDDARALAKQGIEAMNQRRFTEALGYLRQAEDKFHAPTHLLLMARCHVELQQFVEAHVAYASVLVEKVPNYAPEAFHKARASAQEEIEAVRGRVATVRIAARSAGGAPVTVYADGKEIPAASLALPIAVTPGSHRFEAHAPGVEPQVQEVTVSVGTTQDIRFTLGGGATDTDQPPDGADTSPPPDDDGFPVAATIALAVGGAALAAGAITGGITLSQSSDIKDNCQDNVCPLEEEAAADDAKAMGHASTALFIVGGVAAVTGVVLLAIDLGGSDAPADTASRPKLEARLAPTGFLLRGRF